MKQRFVLDTNVLVSGLQSRNGASFLLLKALQLQEFELLVSVPLWFEYESVLKREHIKQMHGLSNDQVDIVLNALASLGQGVELHFLWRPQLSDPLDEMVLETALNGRADALVTFNLRDFGPAAHFGLPVITPAMCLNQFRSLQ